MSEHEASEHEASEHEASEHETSEHETTVENPNTGQGAVVLDIGGDIGALVVTMPDTMDGVEVEIVPTGSRRHEHDTGHGHTDGHGHPPHVAVVARPTPSGVVHSLVFGELTEGTYDLYVRPDGPVRLTASVTGGAVTDADWPTD